MKNVISKLLIITLISVAFTGCIRYEFRLNEINSNYKVGKIPSQPEPALVFQGGKNKVYQVLVRNVSEVYANDSIIYLVCADYIDSTKTEYLQIILSNDKYPDPVFSLSKSSYMEQVSQSDFPFEFHNKSQNPG